MSHEKIALLRTLAARPSRTVVSCLHPLLEALSKEGLVFEDRESGWCATAKGCDALERSRGR
jgi:hypothetical protein